MSKKDYEHAADLIRRFGKTEESRRLLVDTFSIFFAADSPRFKGELFRKACNND